MLGRSIKLMPEIDWEDLLLAWLHDPFDKALRVQGHESRAKRYASAALGREVSRRGLHRLAAQPDVQAAIAERVPSPTAGDGARAVGPADGLGLTHPTSGAGAELKLRTFAPEPDRAVALIKEIVRGLPGPRERFLAVWRLLPDQSSGRIRGGRRAAAPRIRASPTTRCFNTSTLPPACTLQGRPTEPPTLRSRSDRCSHSSVRHAACAICGPAVRCFHGSPFRR